MININIHIILIKYIMNSDNFQIKYYQNDIKRILF